MDVSTLQRPVLTLDVSTLQSPVLLHLGVSSPQGPGAAPMDVYGNQKPELLLDLYTSQGSELHLDVSRQ